MTDEERAQQAILSAGEPRFYTDTPPNVLDGVRVTFSPGCGCPPAPRERLIDHLAVVPDGTQSNLSCTLTLDGKRFGLELGMVRRTRR